MIFDADDEFDDSPAPPAPAVPARQLLAACAGEAARLAGAIDRLDREMARLLREVDRPGTVPQQIDLLRQEAAGLAALLHLVAGAPTPDHVVDHETVAGLLKLRAQQGRIFAR